MRLDCLLRNRKGAEAYRGIYSVCTAHPLAIRAAMRLAQQSDTPLLIEATSNQVNQFGGYTGMRPADLRRLVTECAGIENLPMTQLILGGDHLGPNPWQRDDASRAMMLAEEMISEYASEGFEKIHLDASMPCAGDPAVLPPELVAERSARLCSAAESAGGEALPLYVIGTEVPIPGGATEDISDLQVTAVSNAQETLDIHRKAFAARGLESAWRRVIAMVVQPGVEFNHDFVRDYDPESASQLAAWINQQGPLVFEAHSTDYQRPGAYLRLVNDGFAILKVGPAVTFAMREAFYALARIEDHLVPRESCSSLPQVADTAMLDCPSTWNNHYSGTPEQQGILRTFSYSDRIRYYWNKPQVQKAVDKLISNLSTRRIPETLLSAYLPNQYVAVRSRQISSHPIELVIHACKAALQPYATACFEGGRGNDQRS